MTSHDLIDLSPCDDLTNASIGSPTVHLEIETLTLGDELREMTKNLRRTRQISDFTLQLGGQEFQVHKFVLLAHASYFSSISADKDREELLFDMKPSILEILISYLYEGQVEIAEHELQTVLKGAQLLGIKSLFNRCQGLVSSQGSSTSSVPDEDTKRVKEDDLLNCPDTGSDILRMPAPSFTNHLVDLSVKDCSPTHCLKVTFAWVRQNSEDRTRYLPDLLQMVQLENVPKTLIQQALQESHVQKDLKASQVLKNVLHKPRVFVRADAVVEEVEKADYLVTFGHVPGGSQQNNFKKMFRSQRPSNKVMAVGVGPGLQSIVMGQIETHVPEGAKCCLQGKTLYVAGLGRNEDELWKWGVDDGDVSKACQLRESRRGHAMCFTNGHVYILGGATARRSCTATVEAYNPRSGTCSAVGQLDPHYLLNAGGCFTGLVCCPAGDEIVVCGAYRWREERGLVGYQHTVQLFSPALRRTTHCLTLQPLSDAPLAGVLLVQPRDTLLVFCREYTAVCTLDDVKEGRTDRCIYRERYSTPNDRCAVLLTSDGKHVVALGGQPAPSSGGHLVHRAKVNDILEDAECGWEKMDWDWPPELGICHMYGYTALEPGSM